MWKNLYKCCYIAVCLFVVSCNTNRDKYVYENIKLPSHFEHKEAEVKKINSNMSLAQLVKYVLANNKNIKQAELRIIKSSYLTKISKSRFLPTLDLHIEAMRSNRPSNYLFKSIDQSSLQAGVDFNNPGIIDNFGTDLRLNYNLYNGGLDLLNQWQAQTGLSLQRLNYQSLSNTLIASVINAWYNLKAANDYICIAQESAKTISVQLKHSQKRFSAGGDTLKSDILALQVRLAQAEESILLAKNNKALLMASLATLMGLDADRQIILSDDDSFCNYKYPNAYEIGLKIALQTRPELKSWHKKVELSAIEKEKAQSSYMPKLNLMGSVGFDDADMKYDFSNQNWMIALGVDWNIFNGMSNYNNLKSAKIALKEALRADEQATLMVQLDVKKAYLNKLASMARKKVTKTAIKASAENLKLVQLQYREGAVDITRYLQAELALTSAKLHNVEAGYECKKAYAQIMRSIGLFANRRIK